MGVWKDDKRVNWAGEESDHENEPGGIQIQINKVPVERLTRPKKIFV